MITFLSRLLSDPVPSMPARRTVRGGLAALWRLRRQAGEQRVPNDVEQLLDPGEPILQIEPAEQRLKRGGRAVFARRGVLRDRGLCGVLAPAHHGQLDLGQKGLDPLQRRALALGSDKMHRRGVQPPGHKTGALHQPRAHQRLKYAIAHKGQ